ncbi:hypothetical protein [Nitratifractor sp.]|uniref:hypothetical protein n=1 Tax=Nitratifractor sp. TaxID=2268144 RepID=UPI0025DC628B|nr:hypothetical protein [Nitratifractor sp.]
MKTLVFVGVMLVWVLGLALWDSGRERPSPSAAVGVDIAHRHPPSSVEAEDRKSQSADFPRGEKCGNHSDTKKAARLSAGHAPRLEETPYSAIEVAGDEAEAKRPSTVSRDRLIGGADVVWIAPESKKNSDSFGEPPI